MKFIQNFLFLILFIFVFFSISKVSYAQDSIYLNFDWLSSFCQNNEIQISWFTIFLRNGIDSIGIMPLFEASFHSLQNLIGGGYTFFLSPVYNFNHDITIGYIYTIEFGDFSISKKIKINDYFTYYPGITFYLRFSSVIITDKEYEDEYYYYNPEKPVELLLKAGISQSIEYNFNKFILKISMNIFYSFYFFNIITMDTIPHIILELDKIKGHYFVFQFFVLPGFIVNKNIKLFFGLTTYLSTKYLIKDVTWIPDDSEGMEFAPRDYPIEYRDGGLICLVIYFSIG